MRHENAAKSAAEIMGEHKVNRIGKYSYKNSKKQDVSKQRRSKREIIELLLLQSGWIEA